MHRGKTLPPIVFPLAAFAIWIYLFFSYLETLQSDLESPLQILQATFFLSNLILVIAWFLHGRLLFVIFASVFGILTAYLILALREVGLWIQIATMGILYLWLDYLSGLIDNEKLVHLVNREKVQADLNLSHKDLSEKDHLHAALKKKLERLHYLREFSDHLKDKNDMKEISRIITAEVAKLLPSADQILLYIMDPKTHELGLVFQHSRQGKFDARAKKGNEYDEWVIRRSQPLLIDDVKTDFRFAYESDAQGSFRSACIVPLVSERKVFAVLHLNAVQAGVFHTDDLRFLDIAADLSAVSLRNVLLFEKTKELSIVDSLTECYLYRYVQDRITEEIHRALRSQIPFSLIMADIDHFKRYNDEFGHTAGDMVLKGIAEVLRTSVGSTDIVGRYGGEEFVLVLPQKNYSQAVEIAEFIRKRVEERNFHLRREKRTVTLSLGISVFPEGGTTKEELLWKADKNLYEAKRQGRNRVFGGGH